MGRKLTFLITNVSTKKQFVFEQIHFELNNFSFMILVEVPEEETGPYQLLFVFHQKLGTCPFCHKHVFTTRCDVLREHIIELFDKLIACNQLRSEWLFRQYTLKGSPRKDGE